MLPSQLVRDTVVCVGTVATAAGWVVMSRARGVQRSDDSAALEQGSRSRKPVPVMRQSDELRRGPTPAHVHVPMTGCTSSTRSTGLSA